MSSHSPPYITATNDDIEAMPSEAHRDAFYLRWLGIKNNWVAWLLKRKYRNEADIQAMDDRDVMEMDYYYRDHPVMREAPLPYGVNEQILLNRSIFGHSMDIDEVYDWLQVRHRRSLKDPNKKLPANFGFD